jgi:hypothetical protein
MGSFSGRVHPQLAVVFIAIHMSRIKRVGDLYLLRFYLKCQRSAASFTVCNSLVVLQNAWEVAEMARI